jgi:hypothetical protein
LQTPGFTPGILPFALRASLRLFKIAPGDFVCPSCGVRRMVESAAHLVDHVFPEAPIRQFVLTFPFPLRFLLAAVPKALTEVLAVVQRRISTFLIRRTGFTNEAGLGHAGGTSPGMDSVERSRMPEPSATQELLPRGASADPQDSGTCSA